MSGKQGSILIVDDEEMVRKLLHQKLSTAGYQCQEAGSADQALDKLRNNPVELVISDIKMPGKSGIELLAEVKAMYPDTAIIMATAVADTATAVQCMKQGAYDYITKPFHLDEVVLGLERALEKRRLELENRDYQLHLEQKVEEQTQEIRASFLDAIAALVYAQEAKDQYTSGHSQRVAEISAAIASELGMSGDDIEKIKLAGSIHDIGKIGIRDAVLHKPGKLTDDEYKYVISHCEIGEHILSPIVRDKGILDMVRHHHERYDGTGYPDGLSVEQIPRAASILAVAEVCVDIAYDHSEDETLSQTATILAVADAYDAMTSDRPYQAAFSVGEALKEIRRGAGSQFDPEVVDALLRIKEFTGAVV